MNEWMWMKLTSKDQKSKLDLFEWKIECFSFHVDGKCVN